MAIIALFINRTWPRIDAQQVPEKKQGIERGVQAGARHRYRTLLSEGRGLLFVAAEIPQALRLMS
jgi:hypothetical protein